MFKTMGKTESVELEGVYAALKYITNLLARPLWIDPTTSRAKADVVVSSGTVTTTTTLTNLGAANVTGKYIDNMAWGENIRLRIT